ncbi:YvrJ family protein [Peptoniphilus harei]|uniref:YvrJ family protein n=1 Tax=Peptoniphilus harei TaxID=54005 RepID=UPI00189B7863|nr:YvrJ family protein [Peptoniphilus harei]
MDEIMQYFDQSTFAMLLTIYLLVKFDKTINQLNQSIAELKIEIAKLQSDCKIRNKKDEE